MMAQMDLLKTALSFDDILLIPQYSEIESRKEIEIIQNLRFVGDFSLPIISSPMDTVTGESMAGAMDSAGGVGIIHRYNSAEEQASMVMNITSDGHNVGAAIGIGEECVERGLALARAGVSFLCIDVAHGHHHKVQHALRDLRKALGSDFHIMAGNVATLEAFNDLADWGANSIRVGIGGGSICSTRIQTGHGMPTLQSVMDCAQSDRDAVLVADGGIRTSGDIVKALAAGADFVMLGSLLAGTDETPGSVIHTKNGREKVYRGMASKEAQRNWRNRVSSIEGVSHTVALKGPVGDVLEELRTGIRSGISYSGANSIPSLQAKSRFIRQTQSGQVESSTHIKRI
jgi:IMP dehydrogenase